MGQYGNQPDFGTRAENIVPVGNAGDTNVPSLNSAALYIGTGGTLVCEVVGGNSSDSPTCTIFNNIPDGTFFPVIVNRVWVSDADDTYTTCADIVALY